MEQNITESETEQICYKKCLYLGMQNSSTRTSVTKAIILFHHTHYVSMQELKFIHVSESGHRSSTCSQHLYRISRHFRQVLGSSAALLWICIAIRIDFNTGTLKNISVWLFLSAIVECFIKDKSKNLISVLIASNSLHKDLIVLIQKSHNATYPYPTMHHFVTEMCTCAHFCYKWCIVGYLSDAIWDLWDGSVDN